MGKKKAKKIQTKDGFLTLGMSHEDMIRVFRGEESFKKGMLRDIKKSVKNEIVNSPSKAKVIEFLEAFSEFVSKDFVDSKIDQYKFIHYVAKNYSDYIGTKLGEFEAHELSSILRAFAVAKFAPSQDFIASWESQALQNFTNFGEYFNGLKSLNELGVHVSESFINATAAARTSFKNLPKLLHQLALHWNKVDKSYQNYLIQRIEKLDLSKLSLIDAHELYLASQSISELKEYLQHNKGWQNTTNNLKEHMKAHEPYSSNSHIKFHEELSRYLGESEEEVFFEEIMGRVDIKINDNIVVQYDGPSHFVLGYDGKLHTNYSTEENTHILEENKISVLRVPFVSDSKEIISYIEESFAELQDGKGVLSHSWDELTVVDVKESFLLAPEEDAGSGSRFSALPVEETKSVEGSSAASEVQKTDTPITKSKKSKKKSKSKATNEKELSFDELISQSKAEGESKWNKSIKEIVELIQKNNPKDSKTALKLIKNNAITSASKNTDGNSIAKITVEYHNLEVLKKLSSQISLDELRELQKLETSDEVAHYIGNCIQDILDKAYDISARKLKNIVSTKEAIKGAIAECERVIKSYPDKGFAYALKAEILGQEVVKVNDRYKSFIEQVEDNDKLLELLKDPKTLDEIKTYWIWDDYHLSSLYLAHGRALFELGQSVKAIEFFDKVIEYFVNNPKAPKDIKIDHMGAAHWNKGSALMHLAKYDDAITSYNECVRLEHVKLNSYGYSKELNYIVGAERNRGIALHSLGRHDESMQAFNAALTWDKEDILGVAIHKLYLFVDLGKLDTALTLIKEIERTLDQKLPVIKEDLKIDLEGIKFLFYKNNGALDKALLCIDKLIETYKDNSLDRSKDYSYTEFTKKLTKDKQNIEKGIILSRLGNYKEAIEAFEKSIELNEYNADAYREKAKALVSYSNSCDIEEKEIHFEQALEDFKKAIAINPDDFEALYNQAILLMSLGYFVEATESLQRAAEIDDNNNYPYETKIEECEAIILKLGHDLYIGSDLSADDNIPLSGAEETSDSES